MAYRFLECCICGEYAGQFRQHWNRDIGFGICRRCVDDEIKRGISATEMLSLYGEEGINYSAKVT